MNTYSKNKDLFPPEIYIHIERLDDNIIEQWREIRYDSHYFNSDKPHFSDFVQNMTSVVEKGIIKDSEFVWMTTKAGIIRGDLNRVLDSIAWKDQSPGVRAQSALALSFKGQTIEALELLKAAEKTAEVLAAKESKDIEILVEIWGVRSFTLTVQKKFQEAIGEYIKASQVTEPDSSLEEWLQLARLRHAYSLLKLSFISDASTVNQRCLEIATKSNNRFYKALALNGIGHCLDRVGKTDEAIEKYLQALEESEKIKSVNISSLILNRIGMAHAWRKKKLDDSIDFFRRAIATAQEGESSWLEFGPMANLAIVKKMKGAFFEAGELFESVRDRSEIAGDLNDQLFAFMNLADIYQELGDFERAKENKLIAQDLARQLRKS